MKKLLSLLTSISLIAASSSLAVACPAKNEAAEDNKNDGGDSNGTGEGVKDPEPSVNYESVLNEFKKEVSNIIDKQLKSSHSLWFENIDKSQNKFFDKNFKNKLSGVNALEKNTYKISEILKKNNDENSKNAFLADVKSHLNYDAMKNEIDNLKKNAKYNIVVGSLTAEKILDIDFSKFMDDSDQNKVVFSDEVETGDANVRDGSDQNLSKYVLNLSLDVNFKLTYVSNNQSSENSTSNDPKIATVKFGYTLTGSEKVEKAVKEAAKTLKYKYITDSKFSSLIKPDSSINGDDKFINDSTKINSAIQKVFDKDEFLPELTKTLNDLFSSQGTTFKVDASAVDSASLVDDVSDKNPNEVWDYNLYANSQSRYKWKDKDKGTTPNYYNEEGLAKNQSLYDYIFKNIEKGEQEGAVNYDEAIKNYILENIGNWTKTYSESIINAAEDLNDQTTVSNKDDLLKAIKRSVSYKIFKIENLKLEVSGGFKIDLNQLFIAAGYTVSNKEEDITAINKENYESSQTFKSIKANIINGIKKYHEVYGIGNTTESYSIAGMKGGENSLFDSIDIKFISNYEYQGSYQAIMYWDSTRKRFNSVLSLNKDFDDSKLQFKNTGKDAQALARHKLLSEGNQSYFGWEMAEKSTPPLHLRLANASWLSGDKVTRKPGLYINSYNGDQKAKTVEFNFTLNFVNIRFVTDGIWTHEPTDSFRYKPVIEKI
ncbi:hypothetical protein SHELI_v1c05170 [Spiroplasma helicoides]|uniref:Lipoprotein n=1 Tax=Spiroplasma helicoides TaxID=216938 RepID=A0A1B3SKJ9_9MOLU|nr:lipoprotein [Spiroplasma helicoides]AOG60468.1 hypothetical protein SHELI_v1c05170 [Spiroplasma helicoides]